MDEFIARLSDLSEIEQILIGAIIGYAVMIVSYLMSHIVVYVYESACDFLGTVHVCRRCRSVFTARWEDEHCSDCYSDVRKEDELREKQELQKLVKAQRYRFKKRPKNQELA